MPLVRPGRQPALSLLLLAVAAVVLLAGGASIALAANHNVTFTTGGSCGGLLNTCQCPSSAAGSFAYSPGSLTVAPGDTVTFTNPGSSGGSHACAPDSHPTNCVPGASEGECPFATFQLDPGATHAQPFPTEGTFYLRCIRHPQMDITVTVGDGVPDEPDPEPTEPDPAPTEPDEPDEPAPAPTSEPAPADEPTSTPSAATSPTPTASPTVTPTATDLGAPTPSPTPSVAPISQPEVVVGGTDDGSRGPLLIVATTLLGIAIGGLLWARELLPRP